MRKIDRARLSRLQAALNAVRFPHDGSGSQTATVRGMAEYQAQMRYLMPLVREAITAICCHADEGYSEWGDPPDEVLARLEAAAAAGVTP